MTGAYQAFPSDLAAGGPPMPESGQPQQYSEMYSSGAVFQGTYAGQMDGNMPQGVMFPPRQQQPPQQAAPPAQAYQLDGTVTPASYGAGAAGAGAPMQQQQQGMQMQPMQMQAGAGAPGYSGQMAPLAAIPVAQASMSPAVMAGGFPSPIIVGTPPPPPINRWSDGLCDCFSDGASCCWAWWFSPYRFARTMERSTLMPFNVSFWIYFILWLGVVGFFLLGRFTNQRWVWWLSFGASIFLAAFSAMKRKHLREKYNIPGTELEDCCAAYVCHQCAVAQEARHVDRSLGLMRPPQ